MCSKIPRSGLDRFVPWSRQNLKYRRATDTNLRTAKILEAYEAQILVGALQNSRGVLTTDLTRLGRRQ